MSADLRPQSGARFELDLLEGAGATARYRARVHLPAGSAELALRLDGGAATLEEPPQGEAPAVPPWARAHLLALGRLLGREAKRDGAFRRRLLRWRGEAEGDG